MINIKAIDELARRLSDLVPPGIEDARADLQKNFKSVLQSGFSRFDLVTREEFDVQRAVLLRTREKVEEMEAQVDELQARLDALAPTHIEVPSGSTLRIDYSDPATPVLAARLQELFGWTETPRIADGRVPLTIHLLSPAQRPVQVTRDLASFWRTGYFDVRRDLRGRYPKHYWPDDPLTATATRRVRPK